MSLKKLLGFNRTSAIDKSHIKNLTEMAQCDGHVAPEEVDLMHTIARAHDISLNQVENIQKNLTKIEFELPEDSRSKFRQLYDLIHMMLADKVMHVEEMKLCYQFVGKLGFPAQRAAQMIQLITINIQNGQNHDETMERVNFALKF